MTNLTTVNQTMSSLEIAKLTGKRHDNVMADIANMLKELEIQSPEFSGDYKDSKGRTYGCYNLPKRECLILVSGYSVELRAKIIDRWQELEAVTQAIADTIQVNKEDMIKELKQDNTIAKLQASIQASKDKAKASQLKLQALKDKLAKQSEILNARTTAILARGAKVKGDLIVGKLDLPTDCITELLKALGSPLEPKLANLCLRRLGYLTPDNKVTELGLAYGKTIKTSPKAKTTLARWYVNEFPELLEKIMQEYEELVNE